MVGQTSDRIETGIDSAAAALYAAATALVLSRLSASDAYVVFGALTAFAGCFYGLRSVEPEPTKFALGAFEPAIFELAEPSELVLTDGDRLHLFAADDEPLVLDDILAEIGPDSRVVRLFDRAAMPTPGELNERVDRHLGKAADGSSPADASAALHQALAELRRSLR